MPRLSHALLRKARQASPLLAILLKTSRTLPAATNELRWLREHAQNPKELQALCRRRGNGEPLQYILGSQPFGDLEILCRPGVLIPRPETEAYTSYLASFIRRKLGENTSLRILDICTGTGCIPLLLHAELAQSFEDLKITGLDISQCALNLANENLQFNQQQGHLSQSSLSQVSFSKRDILNGTFKPGPVDVVISNPPYISNQGFGRDTGRSVRNWEPKLALVPREMPGQGCLPEDIFYPKILDVAKQSSARIVLMEVGDIKQARRVADMIINLGVWKNLEIWRDWPDQTEETIDSSIKVRGQGHGRSVVCWT